MPITKSWFILSSKKSKLTGFEDAHVRFAPPLAEKFISAYTKPKDKIFDPFTGFGTTLLAAKKLDRIGIGIEYDEKKIEWLRPQLPTPHQVIHGSSLNIKKYNLPKIDMVFGSPPYMRFFDKENPLSNYTKKGSYASYLKGMTQIYTQLKSILKKNAPVVIEIENTFDKSHPSTPLAWDVGKLISKIFYFERDFIQCYKEGDLKETWSNNNHSYCLMFRNK